MLQGVLRSLLSAWVLLCLGCDYGERTVYEDDGGIKDLPDDEVPDIAVEPEEIDFGVVTVGDDEWVDFVTISNIGEADLHIQNIELDDPSAPFLLCSITSVLVSPGGSAQFEVIFAPDPGEIAEANILIDSDDPDEPVSQVQLYGEGES